MRDKYRIGVPNSIYNRVPKYDAVEVYEDYLILECHYKVIVDARIIFIL